MYLLEAHPTADIGTGGYKSPVLPLKLMRHLNNTRKCCVHVKVLDFRYDFSISPARPACQVVAFILDRVLHKFYIKPYQQGGLFFLFAFIYLLVREGSCLVCFGVLQVVLFGFTVLSLCKTDLKQEMKAQDSRTMMIHTLGNQAAA